MEIVEYINAKLNRGLIIRAHISCTKHVRYRNACDYIWLLMIAQCRGLYSAEYGILALLDLQLPGPYICATNCAVQSSYFINQIYYEKLEFIFCVRWTRSAKKRTRGGRTACHSRKGKRAPCSGLSTRSVKIIIK